MIVPAFNAERTLGETLGCVAAQTYRNIELLIVDDGSTDGTLPAADRFCGRHGLGTLLSQANGGVAKARNRAIAHSKGAFLAPLDSDDLWHPTYIEKMVAAATAPARAPVLVYSHTHILDRSSTIVASGHDHVVDGPAGYAMQYCNLVGSGSGMIVRRDACDAAGGYSEILHAEGIQGCEDYLLQMRLAATGPIAAVDEYLVGYRLVDGSMSSDRMRMFQSERRARELFRTDRSLAPPPPWLERWIEAGLALREARAAMMARAAGESARSLLRAWTLDPVGAIQAVRGTLSRGGRIRTPSGPCFHASDSRAKADRGASSHGPAPFSLHQAQRLDRIGRLDREVQGEE